MFDLFVLIAIGVLTLLGYWKGFARQLVGFAALIAVYFFATPVAALVRLVLFAETSTTFPGIEVASLVIAAVILFVGVYLIGRIFIAAVTALSERLESLDAILGAVLGFIKGTLGVYLLLCVLVYAESPIGSAMPSTASALKSSYSMSFARHYNLITYLRYPELSNLREALVAAEDPEKRERNESLARLMENEDFQGVVADEDLMKAAAERDYSQLLADERVLRLLTNEDFQKVLTETDWGDVIDE